MTRVGSRSKKTASNFKTIIEAHNKIKTAEGEGGQGVIPLLIDLIQHQQFDFLIPHMFLTGQVLDGYYNVHFSCLGSIGDIMNAIESLEHKLDQQEIQIMGEHNGD